MSSSFLPVLSINTLTLMFNSIKVPTLSGVNPLGYIVKKSPLTGLFRNRQSPAMVQEDRFFDGAVHNDVYWSLMGRKNGFNGQRESPN